MAITSFDPRNPRIAPSKGVPQITDRYSEANSQSFKAGYPVAFSAGAVTIATAGDLPIAGIALADATNVSSGNIVIPVMLINQDDEVYIQVSDNSGNLQAANTTCVPGVAYDILNTSGLFTINSSDTSNAKFVYIEPLLDATGAVGYWARCKPYYAENQVTAA